MGVALVTKRVVNACPKSAILVVHFIVGAIAVLMAKLGTKRSISVSFQFTEVSGRIPYA